jgi:hypothetical protein
MKTLKGFTPSPSNDASNRLTNVEERGPLTLSAFKKHHKKSKLSQLAISYA